MRKTMMVASMLASTAAVSFANKAKPDEAPAGETTDTAPVAATETAKAARVAPEITPAKMVTLPPRKAPRGSKSAYPFDTLTEVGMSFGVKNKTRNNMNSIVHNANKAHLTDKLDDTGAKVFKTTKSVDPTTNVTTMVPTTETEKVATKRFYAVDVDPKTDEDGASVRIVREL